MLKLALAALVLSGMSSCVKEDMSHCTDPRGNVCLRVRLDDEIDSDGDGASGYLIESTHVYVFDARGRYVASAEGGEFTGDCEFWFTLPSGDYDFVAWTNQGDNYRVHQKVEELEADGFTMDNLELFLDHGGKALTNRLPDLLHGINREVKIAGDIDNLVEMAIAPLTYTVNLKALKLPAGDQNYAFTIVDNNSHYDFDGGLIEGMDNFRHTRTAKAPGGEFNASIRTLALKADRHPRFTFGNAATGEILHEADLIYTITRAYAAANRAVDFDTTRTFDIVLTFDAVTMDFTVTVNGWEYDERNEILD